MSVKGKVALFIGGTLFGSAGLKILSGRDARKAYTHVAAATLRCRDEVMKQVESVQEGCSDILADARQINEKRRKEEEMQFIEDTAETEFIEEPEATEKTAPAMGSVEK